MICMQKNGRIKRGFQDSAKAFLSVCMGLKLLHIKKSTIRDESNYLKSFAISGDPAGNRTPASGVRELKKTNQIHGVLYPTISIRAGLFIFT